jgi:PhnB protein
MTFRAQARELDLAIDALLRRERPGAVPPEMDVFVEVARELSLAPARNFQNRLRNELREGMKMPHVIEQGVRQGFTTLTPYIRVEDIDKMVAYVKRAFGAVETERARGSAGGVHVELRLSECMLMCGGGGPVRGREMRHALHYYVDDVEAVYRRAVEAGGESVHPPVDRSYGERQATVNDPAGNQWYIATPTRALDPALRSVTPYLLQKNALELIEFLKVGLGAEEIGIVKSPAGDLMHGALRIGNGAFEIGETDTWPVGFYVYVPDADALYQRAIAAGATSIHPPVDQPYGDRMGAVKDPNGNEWYIASHMTK